MTYDTASFVTRKCLFNMVQTSRHLYTINAIVNQN
jgi:hypothetical protein